MKTTTLLLQFYRRATCNSKFFQKYCILCILVSFFLSYNTPIYAQLTGNYTVGTMGTEDFSSLTNPGGLFESVNINGLSGPVTVEITTDLLSESGDIALDQWVGAFPLTIVPESPSLKTIHHTSCTKDLINIHGADLLTFDGRYNATGTQRYLRFESLCTDKSIFRFELDCENDTIRNCIVSSDNDQISISNGGAIHVERNQTFGSDNLKILHNLIIDDIPPASLFDAIQINAPDNAGESLSGLEISYNEIVNANGKGIFLITQDGSVESASIENNSFYATEVITGPGAGWTYSLVQIESGGGHRIKSNSFGGQAPMCMGGKMNISLTNQTRTIALIRLKDDVPNAAVNEIDRNIFRNISMLGDASEYLNASIIRIENGNTNIGSTMGNLIGDSSLTVTSALDASISMIDNMNSTSNVFRGIYTSSTGTVNIENNSIGGIYIGQNNPSGVNSNMIYSSGSSALINNNYIGGSNQNIVKNSDNDFRVIYSNGDDSDFTISGNTMSGIYTGSEFLEDLYGIRVANGTGNADVYENTLDGFEVNGDTRVYGIRVENPNAQINHNVIRDFNILSSQSGVQFYGIHSDISSAPALIHDNLIEDINLLNNTALQTNLVTIYSEGGNKTIHANMIRELSMLSTSNSSYFRGIQINSSTSTSVYNNVILIDNKGLLNDVYIYGIYDQASSGNNSIYHNTVDIRGDMLGSRRSSCYYKTSSTNRDVQNNFFNNRRTGGSGGHYAMYFNTTGGALISDYNLLYAEENTNKLVRFGGDHDFNSWQAAGYGSNSVNPLTPQELCSFSNGIPLTIAGIDIGNVGLGVTVDILGTLRPQLTGFDLGAYELSDVSGLVSPLPIELSSFDVVCQGRSALIQWSTNTEFNNMHFNIKKSLDGYNWSTIGTVNAAGNSTNTINYQFIDQEANPSEGAYYQLEQVDFDGGTESYLIVHSDCTGEKTEEYQVGYANNAITVNYSGKVAENTHLTIYNSEGKIAETFLIENTFSSFPFSHSQGMYFLTINNNNTIQTGKLLVW